MMDAARICVATLPAIAVECESPTVSAGGEVR
jgi:hypothetical protein